MKKILLLICLITSVSLYSQEFDGTYKVYFIAVEGDGLGVPSGQTVKWYATIKGDEVVMYDSKKMNNSIYTETIGTSTEGDVRKRSKIITSLKNEIMLVVTTVDDFTKRVVNTNYMMKKQKP